ncbi:MAG: hypothetical protein RBT49_12560 [Bacteroidales bacterium]|jgi:endonuclease/exonuclease/phosphatase family metal-dependent hydrolase|nr:hypothetical protein [Bacteroidales bacterium]
MKLLKFLAKIILVLAVLFIAFLVFATLTNYKPAQQEIIFESTTPDSVFTGSVFNLMSWNIGYCGLSADMDFFYDGGNQVRTTKNIVLNNLIHNLTFIKDNDSLDFILLQEVDEHSKRSYYSNQVDSISKRLTSHPGFFAKNYDVKFVPIPPKSPLGRVKSGLNSYSIFNPSTVTRFSFPGSFDWPINLFNLDRCFLVMRFPTTNGKELLIINTHNSAYDDGSLKKQEMDYLKTFLLEEYAKGNYIFVGGDWNQNPPEMDQKILAKKASVKRFVLNPIAKDFVPSDWTWAFDSDVPSNRYLDKPYNKEKSTKVTIDFFLLSPNIEKTACNVIDQDFKYSDHQPVICVVKLK